MVAEADDALMEKFFEAGTLTQEELTAGLGRAVRAGRLFPVFCTSGLRNIGIQPLADAIVTVRAVAGRSAVRRARRRRARRPTRPADDKAPLVLWVWKTIADPFAGRITMFRVVSGVLKSDATVHNLTRDVPERFGHVLALQGKTQTHVPELHAGDLGAVAKLKDTRTERHARRQGRRLRRAADHVPGTRARLRHRAQEPRRRGQDRPGDAAAARGGSVDQLRARSADARAAALRARASCTSK